MVKKGKKSETKDPEFILLNYELAELPSSQHRAGLAGLVLMLEWLDRLPASKRTGRLEITRLDDFGLTLKINEQGLADVFNETYAATTEEYWRKKPLTNKAKEVIEPLDIKTVQVKDKKGQTKEENRYLYDRTVPSGAFLADPSFDPSSNGKEGVWVKLWRDLVWTVFRLIPSTRTCYEDRAKNRPCNDFRKAWNQLLQTEDATVKLPSTYFIGAQEYNAENVSFIDRARFQFLLHFWQFVAQVYCLYELESRVGAKAKEKPKSKGYAIAIPDIAELTTFCDAYKGSMRSRSSERSGFRPRESIVYVAFESALDFLRRMNERVAIKTGSTDVMPWILGIDVMHLEPEGKNVRLRSSSRVDPDRPMVDRYSTIRTTLRDPRFRLQRLRNLVANRAWHSGFFQLIATTPYKFTIHSNTFQHDARQSFDQFLTEIPFNHPENKVTTTDANSKNKTNPPSTLEEAIYSMVGQYLSKKLKSKYDLEWNATKSDADKKSYNEKREKIATEAFLQIRSRTNSQDFINFFTSSICSVSQFLPENTYYIVAQDLLQRTDDVRALTLLALSARS